ncbi:MAG: exosortase E/protease, VPEID-CTERM system [Halioglobus sp.]|nr:exosortase E/protease, VPEID-CTERM system [Halioglobus sp.]
MLILVFAIQFEVIEVSLRAHFVRRTAMTSVWAPFFELRHFFFSFIIVFPAALLLMTWPRARQHLRRFENAAAAHLRLPRFALQLIVYTCFAFLTYMLSVHPQVFSGFTPLALMAWALLLLSTALCSLLVLAPGSYWSSLFKRERNAILMAGAATLLATGFTLWLQHITSAMTLGALYGSHALLSLFYPELIFDVSAQLLGANDFIVKVNTRCAGYEGIALIFIFMNLYLWLFRQEFQFPRVLIALPLGLVIIYLFNIARIATLIAIGDKLSPAIALAGFHSNAGWIAFLLVFFSLIWLLHTLPYFRRSTAIITKTSAMQRKELRTVDALLIPFAVLLGSILIVGAFSTEFDALYPVKVILTGLTLWHFRSVYDLSHYHLSFEAIAAGAMVFLIWIILVPSSPELSSLYARTFAQWPAAVTSLWLFFRIVGSVITVPLAEELAFRGYLLTRLAGEEPTMHSRIRFNLFAFLVSSLLFGLMHGDWLAGILAGMAYAWVRYRSGRLGDAIVAHMITNMMLSFYVLITQQWSYW